MGFGSTMENTVENKCYFVASLDALDVISSHDIEILYL